MTASTDRRRKVLVIGSLNADLVAQAARLPLPGETVIGGQFHLAAGGKGANQAVAAARMGSAVAMIGRIGNDSFGSMLRDELQRAGVGFEHVLVDPTAPTGTGHVFIDAQGRNAIIVASGANQRLTAEDLASATSAWLDVALVVLQLEVPLSTVDAAIRQAAERDVPVLLNAAPAQALPRDLLRAPAWIVVNEVEAEQLAHAPVRSAGDALHAASMLRTGTQRMVVTLGSSGAVLLSDQGSTHVAAPAVEVVDTTAAGDAFVGTLAAALAAGLDDESAVRRAVVAGSLACTRLGAIPSLPTAADLEQFRRRTAC
ncbi:MAG: ribokinase [Deltaproteobacteria bacterium]|nr:ribokinase [Deltaproteobacteria bacterium]